MGVKLEVGDVLLTRCWGDESKVEICQYKSATGFLMYTMYSTLPVLRSDLERFIRETDSLPYSCRIIRKSNIIAYGELMTKIHNKENLHD